MTNAIYTAISAMRSYERSIADLQADSAEMSLELGKLLKQQRKQKHLTLEKAAEIAGRSLDVVHRWEKGCIASLQEVQHYSAKLDDLVTI